MHSLTYVQKLNVLALFGGRNDLTRGPVILNDLWTLKLYNLEWVKVHIGGFAMPLSRYSHSAFSCNSSLYILGGMDHNWSLQKTMFHLNLDQDTVDRQNPHIQNLSCKLKTKIQ